MTGTTGTIQLQRIGTETISVPIVGTSSLIVHKFSTKAKQQMLDNMQGRKKIKEPRDPEKDYQEAAYRMDDGGYGFPVIGVKAAMVSACRFYGKDLPMTKARQLIFVDAEFSKVEGQKLMRINGEPHMREDVVRVGNGGTDLRYRPEFNEWTSLVEITYIKALLTQESVLSLLEAAGMCVGIGEWRPEKSGTAGTFIIDPTREVEVVA